MFLTKIISIVIAAVVAAVVLVPICDSIADNGGSSGGGGGGEGTKETVYTLGESYGPIYPDWPYESYRVYNSTVQGSSPFSITTSDIVGVLDNFRSMNVESNHTFVLGQIITDTLEIEASISVNQYTEGGLEYRAVFQISSFDGEPSYNANIFDTSVAQNQQQGKQGSFEFICSSDGAYTLNMSYYDYTEDAMANKSYSGQTAFMSFLSESENGYYEMIGPLISRGLAICPLFEDQDCVVPYMYIHYLEDDSEEYGVSVFNGKITLDTDNMSFEVVGLPDGVRIWGSIASVDSEYVVTGQMFSSTEDPYDGDVHPLNTYLPTQTVTEGGGSGGSSDTGVTGTLIKTIPIFVILGIILGSVALFYQNRQTI